MKSLQYHWNDKHADRTLELVFVEGTKGCPFTFGDGPESRQIEVRDFFIATVSVTQALWGYIVGLDANPSANRGNNQNLPLENVAWDEITRPGGFLDRINESSVRSAISAQAGKGEAVFRLPSEAEWEYAARGGPHWCDGFRFSGSNDVDAVAWYDRRHGDHTQPVALKGPNQLGIYDMSGNVWEWCHDVYTPEVTNYSVRRHALCRSGRRTRPARRLLP